MRQFRSTCQGCSTAYTYGFWPYVPPKRSVLLEIPSKLLQLQGGSLRLGGSRGPANIGFYPRAWQLPADADDTACVWAALMEHTSTESNTHSPPHLCEVFADWRDIGTDKLRNRREWLPVGSGAYLTWMPCACQVGEHRACPDGWCPSGPKVNDVDIVVNANVLYALGTFGHRGCTGFEDAVRAVNDALDYSMQAFGRIDTSILSSYYPNNNALHYCVARAYRCGDVLDLSPSVKAITTDLTQYRTLGQGRHMPLGGWRSLSRYGLRVLNSIDARVPGSRNRCRNDLLAVRPGSGHRCLAGRSVLHW